jgi:uncharacterized peroxidase-related enzyme
MSRIEIPTREQIASEAHGTLNAVEKQLGFTPNLHHLMALSPAVLKGWLGLMSSLATTLDAATRDGIAMVVSEVNRCHYCLSAHAHVSRTFAGLSEEEISRNREGFSEDPKRQAAIRFARTVIQLHGRVTEADIDEVRSAGYSDANVIEIVALVAQFSMTNFINNVAGTPIDFDLVDPPAEMA